MRFAVVVAALTTVGVLGAVPMTASAIPSGIFIAAPGGTGTDCSVANPCSLHTAITTAGNFTMTTPTVDLNAGTFHNVAESIDDIMALVASDGDATAPVLEGNGSDPVITVNAAISSITGIDVSDGTDGLFIPASGSVGLVQDSSFNNNGNDGIDDDSASFENYTNVTADGNAGSGAAFSGSGGDEIFTSTFSHNGLDGLTVGALVNGEQPNVPVVNSTIYGNDASGVAAVNSGQAELSYSSVINNGERGLYTDNDATIHFGADILADNGSGGAPSQDCAFGSSQPSPQVTDAGYNIVDDNTCPIGANSKQDTSTDFQDSIGPLANYGGPDDTVSIAATSAAAGLVTATPTNFANLCGGGQKDERGLVRPSTACAAGSFDPGASPLPATVTLTASPASGAVVGDTITLTEHVTGDVGPASGGTAMFLMAPSGSVLATITTCNQDTITKIPVIDGVATCQIPASSAGTFHFGASFGGSSTYTFNLADPIDSYTVKDSTTTSLTVDSSTHLSVTVTPDASATSAPTGQISFLVGGLAPSGSPVDLVAGGANTATATLTLSPALTGPATVTAQYVGDGSFAPSSDTVTTKNPTLVAHVTSTGKKTKYGWYDAPVKFTWTCTAGSGTLLGACPAATTLSASKAKQSVKRTISNSVGGTVTVTSTAVNIDRVKPTIRITGVKKGHTYPKGTKLHPKCVAKDALSGLAGRCTLKITHTHFGGKTVYAAFASAKDKAGNGTRGGPYHWDIKTNK